MQERRTNKSQSGTTQLGKKQTRSHRKLMFIFSKVEGFVLLLLHVFILMNKSIATKYPPRYLALY